MAEPRRPRIISTRPTATPAAQQGGPGRNLPHQDFPGDDPAKAGSGAPAPKARATNAKVSVAPVPDEDSVAKDRTSGTASGGPEASRPDGRATVAGKRVGARRSGTGRDHAPSGAQQAGDPRAGDRKTGARRAGSNEADARGTRHSLWPRFGRGSKRADEPRTAGNAAAAPSTAGATAGGEGGARVLAFPEPAHRRRRRRVWLGAAGIAAVLAVVMALALFSPALAVKKVTFDGGRLIADKTLQAAVAPLIGRPLPQVTQGDVDALLAKVPQIKSSSIEARPPSTLLVHVVERVPVALLKVGPAWIQVDQDGVPLGKVADQSKVSLPLINGGTAAVGTATFRAITAVLATLPKSVLGKLASASAKSPDAVELQMVDGKTVVWGNASDMELKAQVLDALVNAPAPAPADGAPPPPPVKVYDVSAPRHPVTR